MTGGELIRLPAMQYEWKTMRCTYPALAEFLQHYSDQGWELAMLSSDSNDSYTLIFKRLREVT